MLNQEIHPPYQPVDDLDGITNSQDSMDGEGEEEYEDEEALEQVEFTKIKRENVFTPIDFTKRKAKIIATIGQVRKKHGQFFRPASTEVKDIVRLMDAGMNMARVNLSHGTQKQNLKLLSKLKQAKRLRPHKTVGLMLEARGREIRLSAVADPSGEVQVRAGSVVHLNCQNANGKSDSKTFYCSNDSVQRYLKPNDVVYFDDGKVIGIVMEILNDGCNLEIKMGGAVRSHCQVRFIGGKHDKLSILNQKDINDFSAVSREIQIDFLVVPFVTSAEDVQNLRDMLGAGGKNIQLIAKIDGINGLENFDEIISKADGVVFQRNELAWEIPSEKLHIAQKWAVQQANRTAKLFMVQSQVLESMVVMPSPDRTEVTEISAGTLDGVDSFILSHETSIGNNAIDSVVTLAKGIAEAESVFDFEQAYVNIRDEIKNQGPDALNIDILATSSCGIAFEKDSDVDMLICLTETGKIARYLAKQRPKQPILACSTSGQTVRQVNSHRGVVGYKIPEHMSAKDEDLLELLLKVAQEQGLCNLPYSKVMIFIGENERDPRHERYTFKVTGGEEMPDENVSETE